MAKKHSPRFIVLCEEAKSRVPEVTVAQAIEMMESRTDIVMVDVREESEWAAGHIRGAVHLGKGVIERDIEKAIPDADAVVILYCGGGYRSALAADALHRMGYQHAVSMQGGWKAWLADNGATA